MRNTHGMLLCAPKLTVHRNMARLHKACLSLQQLKGGTRSLGSTLLDLTRGTPGTRSPCYMNTVPGDVDYRSSQIRRSDPYRIKAERSRNRRSSICMFGEAESRCMACSSGVRGVWCDDFVWIPPTHTPGMKLAEKQVRYPVAGHVHVSVAGN